MKSGEKMKYLREHKLIMIKKWQPSLTLLLSIKNFFPNNSCDIRPIVFIQFQSYFFSEYKFFLLRNIIEDHISPRWHRTNDRIADEMWPTRRIFVKAYYIGRNKRDLLAFESVSNNNIPALLMSRIQFVTLDYSARDIKEKVADDLIIWVAIRLLFCFLDTSFSFFRRRLQ